MDRRHFMKHLAAGSAMTLPTMHFLNHFKANAAQVQKNQKAVILMWLGGGAPTIDMWDLKPGSKNGGEFKPISTKGDLQICEHLPNIAGHMDELSVIRSMSTREADHTRGRYYMHTCYPPNPTVVHPSFGSITSYELGAKRENLAIPSFVSVGGGAGSAGFLGMSHAPFVVDSNGQIRNASGNGMISKDRLAQRLDLLTVVERNFINSKRGDLPQAHKEVYEQAVELMTSQQMKAFNVRDEKAEVLEKYGDNNFGRGLLMARRLVETGVPFVEVNFGGWDLHQDVFDTLSGQRLPVLDQAISGLVSELKERSMMDNVVVICMGEFGRTPRINANTGRDHWAASWSLLAGGGGLKGGQAIGATDKDGVGIEGQAYQPGDLWASVAHTLGIPLNREYQSKLGRPMKLANGGTPIKELIG